MTSSAENRNFLTLVNAAQLMTSEEPELPNSSTAKRTMIPDSSLSVVSASDDDYEVGVLPHSHQITAVSDMDSEAVSDDDLIAVADPPKAPPPILQPEAPPPAPPPPPPAVEGLNRFSSDGSTKDDTVISSSSASSSTRSSDVGSGSGSRNPAPPVLRVHNHNKPQSLPITLMNLLTNEEYHDILSFLPHGKCFLIKQTKEFAKKLMQQHFHLSKFGSFVSRLQRWGFAHLQDSILPGQHAFYHPLFVKGKWEPLGKMMYQPKSTKALKSKLMQSKVSRAGLNRSLQSTLQAVTAPATIMPNSASLLGDLSVSQSTVNHATQNIVDAAIACLRRDQELLAHPRLNNHIVTPSASATAASAPVAVPPKKNFTRPSVMVEPLPPIPPVPTKRTVSPRHSMNVLSPSSVHASRRVSLSPVVYRDNLVNSARSQMMFWQKHQQPPSTSGMEPSVVIPHPPLPPPSMNHVSSSFLSRVGGNGGVSPNRHQQQSMDFFRRGSREMYHRPSHTTRAAEQLAMPHPHAARTFAPVNSFYA